MPLNAASGSMDENGAHVKKCTELEGPRPSLEDSASHEKKRGTVAQERQGVEMPVGSEGNRITSPGTRLNANYDSSENITLAPENLMRESLDKAKLRNTDIT